MYGIRYVRVFDYFSVYQCATGPAREVEVYPGRPQMGKVKAAHISLPYDHCPVTQHPEMKLKKRLSAINTAATRGGDEINSGGEGEPVRKDRFPVKKKKRRENPKRPAPEELSVQVVSWRTIY